MAVTKGITIEFRGNAAPLKSAINSIRNEAKTLDKELGYINKSLKFNPSSVTMWQQKQKVLTQEIDKTNSRLTELKNMKKQLEAQDLDKNSAEFREVEREITKAENKLKDFRKELVNVGSARLTALSESLKGIGKKLTDVGTTLSTQVSLPLSILGGKAVSSFADVDKTMQLTNKTMGNTEEQSKLLSDAMKDAAANSTFGMNDAATATLNFARAGLDAEQSASALAPAMNLAAGEGGSLDTVSAGLVATINGFHGTFDEAGHYADVFANACNNSALDVDSLSNAMSVAAPIFSSAGYAVEDAALYMGVMANNGIEADKAANSLKTGIARLVSPAKQGAEMMEQLGISVTNSDGTMKDSVTIQEELHKAFSQLSESEQIAAASAIFGKNQMAPWLALINTAPESVGALNTSLETTGTTTEMANSMMSGFGGSLEKLKSSLDVAVTSLGEALAPAIGTITEYIQKAVDWFNSLDDSTKEQIATFGLIVAAIGPVLLILGKLFTVVGTVIGIVSKAIGVFKLVTAFLGGPLSLAIAAAIAIGVLLWKNWDKIKTKAVELKNKVVAEWQALKNGVVQFVTALKTGVVNMWNALKERVTTIVSNVKEGIVNRFNSIKERVVSIITGVKDRVVSVFTNIKERVMSIWQGIKDNIVNPIKSAVELVSGFIQKIKNLFSGLKLQLPHFKLPHFRISGGKIPWGIGGMGEKPTIGVDWYAKGGIFTRPTLLGGMNGVGEAGAEAVLPLNKLWEEMDKRFDGTTINVYATPGMDVNELAAEVERRLIASQKRRRMAWA